MEYCFFIYDTDKYLKGWNIEHKQGHGEMGDFINDWKGERVCSHIFRHYHQGIKQGKDTHYHQYDSKLFQKT